jgi:hypothetical protein
MVIVGLAVVIGFLAERQVSGRYRRMLPVGVAEGRPGTSLSRADNTPYDRISGSGCARRKGST